MVWSISVERLTAAAGEDVGGVAELELFAEPGGDFVVVHRCVASWQIDHWFHADGAVIAELGVEPVQQNGASRSGQHLSDCVRDVVRPPR
jgi:hypothetical protein